MLATVAGLYVTQVVSNPSTARASLAYLCGLATIREPYMLPTGHAHLSCT